MTSTAPRVVIVGAGFGGLSAARALAGRDVDVVVVDQRNHHTFQPLLYQVATAGLDAESIAHPVRAIFHGRPNVHARLGTVCGADWSRRELLTAEGDTVPFDRLVLAPGAVSSSFNVPGVDEHAFPLKSITDAVAIRAHILKQFEAADVDPQVQQVGRLTFVIVGGGPTGVEMAGALGLPVDSAGRARVGPDLRVEGRPDVFVIGDAAGAHDRRGRPYPQLAPVAMQQGRHVAREITRSLHGRRPRRFRYFDKGTMATIGRNAAVAELPLGLRFRGFVAWLMWLGLHLVYLIGFRNRTSVLLSWAWNYLTYDRGSRLIVEPLSPEAPPARPGPSRAGPPL